MTMILTVGNPFLKISIYNPEVLHQTLKF